MINQYDMYDQAIEQNYWERRKEASQIIALAGLFVMVAILECVSKEEAKRLVWYLAAIELIIVFISMAIAIKSGRVYKRYVKMRQQRLKEIENGKE